MVKFKLVQVNVVNPSCELDVAWISDSILLLTLEA